MKTMRTLIAALALGTCIGMATAHGQGFEWLERFVTANGGCQNRSTLAEYRIQQIQTEIARDNFDTALFGKPILKWTDDDIETAVRVRRDCEMKIAAPQIAACVQAGQPPWVRPRPERQSFCETFVDLKTPVRQFERYLRDTVTMARARYAQQEAQRKAKIEQEKIEAESKRAQAQEEASRQEQQLLEQAQRDREIAEEARRSAERDEPKIAEATKQAEEARRARQEAEQKLAEIRGAITAQQTERQRQQTERQQHLAKTQELERQVDLGKRGYESISVQTFELDGTGLAERSAKLAISGVYVREGNIDVLYADQNAVMMEYYASRFGTHQPKVSLLIDNASRELRAHFLNCRSDPSSARRGCAVSVLGYATKCTLTNPFGTTREQACFEAEDSK